MANKQDLAVLVQELNEQSGIALNKADTVTLIDNVLEGIKHISKEEKLKLHGFGDFETVYKEAGKAYNPKLLKELKEQGVCEDEAKRQAQVEVAAKNAPKFKFAKGFKDYVK